MQQHTNNKEITMHHGRFGLSLLNSMIGEYLEKENNPLSVKMGFYHQSKKIDLSSLSEKQIGSTLSNKVVVFVHGLANLENVWDYPPDDGSTSSILSHYIDLHLDSAINRVEQNYGTKLRDEYGFTPLFLRYNSGLSLEKNGRKFCQLLNKLFDNYPIKIEELILVGCGMGGQVIGHAQYAAKECKAAWIPALTRCIYLGNINEGSMLSLILRLSSLVMRQLPLYYNHELADWLDNRSRQIQAQNDEEFYTRSANGLGATTNLFLEDKRHYFINGGFKPESTSSTKINSALVPPTAPVHSQNAYLEGVSPARLTHSDRVYQLLSNWITGDTSSSVALHTHVPPSAYPIQEVMIEGLATNDSSNNIFLSGTVDLMASAYDKTLEALETIHYSLTEEPLHALDKLPVVGLMAKSVENAQRDMLDSLYSNLRSRGKKMHKFAAELA